MQVLLAEEMGMCFGVKDALAALEKVERPDAVTIHGQLVHNEIVLMQLGSRGFRMAGEHQRDYRAETSRVLITAHGISDRERTRLIASGKELIDTTCPLVRKVHQAALELQRQGYRVILIGKAGHVEVRGIVEDLNDFDIVASVDEVKHYESTRLGVICQTTVAPRAVEAIRIALSEKNPQAAIRFVDTTCHPTRNRQRSLERLLPIVDVMVVIGGRNSNNTHELVDLCRERQVKTHHVQQADDLRREWFTGTQRVGITAGTSTLDQTINEVKTTLQHWAEDSVESANSAKWIDHFRHNSTNPLAIPWERGAELTEVQARILIPSLQDFQLGESSEGLHGRALARRYGERVGDSHYGEAVRLFFAEENRHSSYLKRFLDLAGAPTIQNSWTDFCFRRIRRLMGLELMLIVLLTAEVIGMIYYRAIYAASESLVLRRISAQLQRDELLHIRFHVERFQMIRKQRSRLRRWMTSALEQFLSHAARLAVWWKHGSVFRLGGYGFLRFWRETGHELASVSSAIRRV